MISLGCRTSAVINNDESKKRSEIRFALLQLPSTKAFTCSHSDSDVQAAVNDFKNTYSQSRAVDQQLAAVNKLIGHFNAVDPGILSDDLLCQILADLYLHAPMKHPLRSILAKGLQKAPAAKGDLVTASLANAIHAFNNTLCESPDEVQTDGISLFVASLNACFDNFSRATAAVKVCFDSLLTSLCRFIGVFSRMLGNKTALSPARRSEVYIDLHNAIRMVLSGVQQFQDLITDASILEPIMSQCWLELLDNPSYADSPVDTKINCALYKVNYDRVFGNIFSPSDKILSQFESSTQVVSKDIFYAIAIINTLTEKDFSEPNFSVALKAIVQRLIGVGKEFTIDSCLIMAVTRALVQCSKKLLSLMRKVDPFNASDIENLRGAMEQCLSFVWINVYHSVDCVRYLTKDLLKNLLRLGFEQSSIFESLVNETVNAAKCASTSDNLACFLLDYLSQVFTTEFVLKQIPDIQQRILKNLFNDSCWAICYEQLMSKNCEIELEKWCDRWIQPLLRVDANEWKNEFDRLKTVRNLFERALKTRPEAAEYILGDGSISIEIYLFVLWIMRRSGRKLYAPENYRASGDSKVIYAKLHPSDEIRILAFRILIECHKTSSLFPVEDLREILEFFRYNCNAQNPDIRQQINTTFKRAMVRIECGYLMAKKTPNDVNVQLCDTYEQFLRDLIDFCVNWCLFDGSNFGRRTTGLTTLLYAVETWQKLLPDDSSIYSEKLWIRMQKTLSDSYTVNKDIAIDILLISWKFYPAKRMIHNLPELRKFATTFRPHDVLTAAHYLVFSTFSQSYFGSYYEAVLWCENLLDDGIASAKKCLLQTARYNALYGLVLSIRHLLNRVDFAKISDPRECDKWRAFFERMVPKCKVLTDVAAPVVNSSAPEGHLPNDLNDVSHYLTVEEESGGSHIKVTAQMILLCAWRTVREAALLLGEIALRTPLKTASNPKGFITIEQLLQAGVHFQQLLVETKHRGAFEQSFLGFSNLCLRLWRSHEPELHSYPTKLIEKIAAIISGERTGNEPDTDLDVKKLCATRRSAGIPFMLQGVATTESQVCSTTALTFCMKTFLHIAKTGPVEESRTHSLNILRSLFKCAELGVAVSEYVSDGIECSIRGYSAPSWPERNSSTLLFSALMTRVFGVQRTKESDNMSIKNKMTGRLFFIRFPRLYDFFYVELKLASEAIQRNERPPRLHPLLLLISRLYPSALEGTGSNLKLSTYIPFISICSSSPELVTRQLSAKSIVALIPSANVADHLFSILKEIVATESINAIHGFLLQIFYLLRSTKQHNYNVNNDILKQFVQIELPVNNIVRKTYLEIVLEMILNDRLHTIDALLTEKLFLIRDRFLETLMRPNQYEQLTQSYVQKPFTIFNLLISSSLVNENLNTGSNIEPNTVAVISSTSQNELIDTQLNIKYLLLSHLAKKTCVSSDFSRYEIELVKFAAANQSSCVRLSKLLPGTPDLYHILNHKNEFYPFGVIKAYEILSRLITPLDAFESDSQLQKLNISEILEIMSAACDEEVDDVAEAMWKYITALLIHCQVDSSVSTSQIASIISYLRNMTQSYKSSGLRQTATDVFSVIIQYFTQSTDMKEIIDFAELLLSLLRDDDVYIRDRTAEIVMDLIHNNETPVDTGRVIPLAAEDYLLEWLDSKFVKIDNKSAWSKWLDLLRLVYKPLQSNEDDNANENGNTENSLVDVDIFDDSEPNMFDETIYTSYKCYNFMIRRMENSTEKENILIEFATLHNM